MAHEEEIQIEELVKLVIILDLQLFEKLFVIANAFYLRAISFCIRPRRRNEKLVMLADQLFKDFVEVGILSITSLGLLTLLVFLLRYDVCAFLVLQHSIVCKIWQPCTQVNIDISFFLHLPTFSPQEATVVSILEIKMRKYNACQCSQNIKKQGL